MKRVCYILTMILLSLSALLMFFTEGISPFYGFFWITILGGLFATIGLTAFIAVLLVVFITCSHFKNGKYKYIVLAIWTILLICNIIYAVEGFAYITYASPIITVVLMVLSGLCAKESEPTEKYLPKPKKIILEIALVTLSVIIIVFYLLMSIIVFGVFGGAIESNIEMKKYIKNEVQTPVSEEIANNFNSTNYKEITDEWVMLNNKTAMLPYGLANFRAYWIIENDPRFVIRVEYDTWDGICKTPMVIKDFEYPAVLTDTVTGIILTDWNNYNDWNEYIDCNIFEYEENEKLELTPEQAETFRNLAFREYNKEHKINDIIKLNNDYWEFEGYSGINKKAVFWSYNDIDTLYYVYGEILKGKSGDYYFCTDFSQDSFSDSYYCTIYEKIPDDIALQLDAVFDE